MLGQPATGEWPNELRLIHGVPVAIFSPESYFDGAELQLLAWQRFLVAVVRGDVANGRGGIVSPSQFDLNTLAPLLGRTTDALVIATTEDDQQLNDFHLWGCEALRERFVGDNDGPIVIIENRGNGDGRVTEWLKLLDALMPETGRIWLLEHDSGLALWARG
jgi:hypothetical protein